MSEITTIMSALSSGTWNFLSFIIALSVIVAVHEYGHYIVGRWCGIHAEVFSVGFGSVLFSRLDKHGTRWQIAALPFGGYVRFKGDANVASGPKMAILSEMDARELRSTLNGAPVWARALTAAAGPIFNFALTAIIYCALFMWQGQYLDNLKIAAIFDLPGDHQLRVGDEITALEGVPVANFQDLIKAGVDRTAPLDYTIIRDGSQRVVLGPVTFPALIGQVAPRSAAIEAGLKSGDVVTHVNDETIADFTELQRQVGLANDQELQLTVWRAGEVFSTTLTPKAVAIPNADGGFDNRRLIGITGEITFFVPETEPLGFVTAITAATVRVWVIIKTSLVGIVQIISAKISVCNLSGPIAIAETAGQMASQGTMPFIALIAGLSTAVGLMNLFPIPILDGGHLVFCAYEAVARRKPNERAVQILMTFGLGFVLFFTIFAMVVNFNCA